jgi:hypothetical protein
MQTGEVWLSRGSDFLLPLERYGELSRDDQFSPLYRLQMSLFYFKSTKGVVNVHGAWFFSKHVTHYGQAFCFLT